MRIGDEIDQPAAGIARACSHVPGRGGNAPADTLATGDYQIDRNDLLET